MAEWSLPDLDCSINLFDSYQYATYPSCYQEKPVPRVPNCPTQAQPCPPAPPGNMALHLAPHQYYSNPAMVPKGDNPREIRNRAEKMRRDRLNQSVAELAAMVPPVVAARRKIDKTTVLRLTAHYLRAHQYVFGDSIGQAPQEFNPASILKVLSLFNGFLITTTYRGIIVVVSQNVHQYLGYTELDLLGQNLLNITHEDDRQILKDQLMPKSQTLGSNGELMIPDEPDATRKVEEALAQEKKHFVIRLKKLGQRSEPSQYVTCHVEGSLRKSDRACRGFNRCCQIVRRARARSENPCSSGNDIVFIGIVRPTSETFINESALESYRMEYRTRHSIDGEIIQCESRIALVTGYMTHEVSGVNAMNFMHRDDVRWVIIALREMYDQHRLFGESCYRLMTKNGQFIYMRTRGRLDVDQDSRAVTSFVCTNTVVNEDEGRHLIKLMRKKFTLMVNNNQSTAIEDVEEEIKDEDEINENQPAPVEDPRRLEQVILHLVTNLPSPPTEEQAEEAFGAASPIKSLSPTHRLTIIPPNKERIVTAIEKIYSIIKTFHKEPEYDLEINNCEDNGDVVDCNNQMHPVTPDGDKSTTTLQAGQLIFPLKTADEVTKYVQTPESPLPQPVVLTDSENEYNAESVFNAVVSPDMGYFDASPSAYSNITSMFASINKNGEEILNENESTDNDDFKLHTINQEINMPLNQLTAESNLVQTQLQPSTSNFSCGLKRPNEFEDPNIAHKKRNSESIRQSDQNSSFDSTILDDLLDDTNTQFSVLSSQIESAMSSLDSIDPAFPDLLISAEVQDYLTEIENQSTEQQIKDKDGILEYD